MYGTTLAQLLGVVRERGFNPAAVMQRLATPNPPLLQPQRALPQHRKRLRSAKETRAKAIIAQKTDQIVGPPIDSAHLLYQSFGDRIQACEAIVLLPGGPYPTPS